MLLQQCCWNTVPSSSLHSFDLLWMEQQPRRHLYQRKDHSFQLAASHISEQYLAEICSGSALERQQAGRNSCQLQSCILLLQGDEGQIGFADRALTAMQTPHLIRLQLGHILLPRHSPSPREARPMIRKRKVCSMVLSIVTVV